jgi:hypothetical protein
MKHTFWFCLCISALLLNGCGKGEASAAETVAGIGSTDSVMEETTEPAYLDTLGGKDFNNAVFSVIGVDYAARRNFPDAETSGEVVNDALTERDNSIMERYHVGIAYTKHENATDVASLVRKEVLANENSWHMAISAISGSLINLMNENVLYDLTELPYLDLSANWWSSPMYEKTQINGHMYITMGDISPQKYYAPYVLAYNKMLAENYHFPDLYEMVLDGKWTLDAFASLTKDMEQDLNGDGKCDVDGIAVNESRHGLNANFYSESGQIRFQIKNAGGNITVSYADYIYEVKVNRDAVDFDALEGFDPLCNGYAYEDKIIVDNLSANSSNFTYDNVLIQNTRTRGIVAKAVGVTLRSCTFRNISCAGVLLAPEPSWGEGTVPRDILIEGCIFDNTGNYERTQSQLKKACIAVMGVGEVSNDITVSNDTLPCSNIKIIGNKFINNNNNYAIVLNAVQDVVVKNNVFVERDDESESRVGKAIYINSCMNIEVSGNVYSKFAENDVTKVITVTNYDGLTGDDVSGVFPQEDLK